MASRAEQPRETDSVDSLPGRGRRVSLWLRRGIEVIALVMVCLSPWAFGAVSPLSEFVLYAGIALMLVLWAARMLLEGQVAWQMCPVLVCLAALFLSGLWQLAPLPKPVLRWLSPATVRLYERLLPSEPEVVRDDEPRPAPPAAAGSSLSLYPGGTRHKLVKLLAVLLLFACVRQNTASADGLRRLSLAALANGALLAIFGLNQFFSAPGNVLYWTYPVTYNAVFGPFLNRNHFAFHINLCLGLGLGLLLDSMARASAGQAAATRRGPLALLLEPRRLGILLGLVLMLCSLVFTLSRGGLIAFVGGSLLCVILTLRRAPRFTGLGPIVLLLLLTLSLILWVGLDRVSKRWANFAKGEALQDSRLALWSRSLTLVRDFPVWGTGLGTYQYVEPMCRTSAADDAATYEFTHNDYLEALVEGGVVRLVLSVVAVGLVFRLGCRALRHRQSRSGRWLVLGALLGFSTLAVHSMVDFGLQIPANAVLAGVLCAHLCALGASGPRPETATTPPSNLGQVRILRLRGLTSLAGAAIAVVLGLVLVREGFRHDRVERFRLAAFRLHESPDLASRQRHIAYLEAAARLTPELASAQLELAHAHLSVVEERREQREPTGAAGAGDEPLSRSHLAGALRHYLNARDLCPLMSQAQIAIAAHLDGLEKAEPREAYLDRVTLLEPADSDLWYACGLHEMHDGRLERAAQDWRRSLELSDRHFSEILAKGIQGLGAERVLHDVLPAKPSLLFAAAFELYPEVEAVRQRQPFLEKALAAFEQRSDRLTAEDLHLRAQIHDSLGQGAEAVKAYRGALLREPQQDKWRYELALILHQLGRLPEARDELIALLRQQPKHPDACQLLEQVTREIIEKK